MKNSLLLFMFFFLPLLKSYGFDKTGKNGGGVVWGRNFPTGNNQFSNEADGGWTYGAHYRRHITADWGIDAAVTRQDYEKICSCTRSNIYDVLAFYRPKGAEVVSPIVGAGLGAVDNGKHQNLHLGMRLRGGIEKALNDKLALAAILDYQMVSKMPGAKAGPQPSSINTLSPKIELTWYFLE